MKISIGASAMLLPAALAKSVSGSPFPDPTATMSARLLEKAVPLKEYQRRHLKDQLQRQLDENNDDDGDYYVTANSYDFASYSNISRYETNLESIYQILRQLHMQVRHLNLQ